MRCLAFSVLALLLLGEMLLPRPALAAPPRPTSLDDAVADGDIDREDLVARAPWAGLPRATLGRAVPGRASGGSAWVSLLGFARTSSAYGGEEVGAALVVGLPLERVAGRRSTGALAIADPAPVSTGAPAAPPERLGDGVEVVLSAQLARASVSAAWRAAGLAGGGAGDDARLDAIATRARWSALLPEARLRAVRGEDERASLESNADSSRMRGSAGADLAMEARLTWRLDRLLFADDEPSFERLRLERHDARMRVAARTLEALFHWQRALVGLRAAMPPVSPSPSGDAPELYLRMLEAEATLDVLTNGWFGQVREARVLLVPGATATPRPDDPDARAPGGRGPRGGGGAT